MINHKLKSIYTHLPKCGGNSIVQILKRYPPWERIGHRTMYWVLKKYEAESYYKFTFVRNPWNRLVSSYHYLRSGGMKTPGDLEAELMLQEYSNFSEFVIKYNIYETKICHFLPMIHYTGDLDNYNYIGKIENLQEDFDTNTIPNTTMTKLVRSLRSVTQKTSSISDMNLSNK